MATTDGILGSSPLKAPAVEIVDLLSDSESEKGPIANDLSDGEDNGEDQWSMYEDALAEMVDDGLADDSTESCTPVEALAFRKRLRLVGEDKFIEETVEAGTITARKLCTAFGIRTPPFLFNEPDDAFLTLLGLGICRELSKRVKLPQYNTIDDIIILLKKSKNIIVLTGAGISTSLGIPDFRSKDTGLYSQLEHLGLSDPQEVFDISIFRENPSIFYSVAKDILPTTNKFSPTHAFIRLLQDKGKLLTNFTQNIDNLEGHAGVSPDKLIQCHGSFATASCVECKHKVNCEVIYKDLKAGRVARCDRCIQHIRTANAGGVKRKRSLAGPVKSKKKREVYEDSTDEEDYDIAVAGVMKPDITFFGEDLPDEFSKRLVDHDKDLVDLVLVLGTSLKVAPVSEVINFLPPEIPQIYISRDPCAHVDFDVDLLGDCDTIVAELCRRAGWNLQHEMIPKDATVNVQMREGHESRYDIKARQ